ncbi:MAG TPA: hypothetical protein VIP70_01940 [Nitrososphaeraceae archaeon]|jgi:hypothetical protein
MAINKTTKRREVRFTVPDADWDTFKFYAQQAYENHSIHKPEVHDLAKTSLYFVVNDLQKKIKEFQMNRQGQQ